MSRSLFIGTAALALLLVAWLVAERFSAPESAFQPRSKPPTSGPLCPWREPESDLKLFFPDATRYALETRILSGRRLELAQRLGRTPTGDENALRVYRIYQEQAPVGAVLIRREKGAYGAIELVVAVGTNNLVRGLRLQRLREPESIARVLENPEWRHSFDGKGADSGWRIGGDIPDVAPEARASAEAVVGGIRDLLTLLDVSDELLSQSPGAHHH